MVMVKELFGGWEGWNGGLWWWGSVEIILFFLFVMSVDDDDDGVKGGVRQGNEWREGGGEGKSVECGWYCYEEQKMCLYYCKKGGGDFLWFF